MKKVLVVGAGLTGAVIARGLAEHGIEVVVVDRRPYLAGNCYTKRDADTDVMVHVHGPHIFHTDSTVVWDYVNNFTEFVPYTLHVKATTKGRVFSLPINLLTINQFFNKTFSPREAEDFIASLSRQTIGEPRTFEDQALKFLGRELYEAFFHGYPIKQWGMNPDKLPAAVLKRLPVRFNYEDNYFAHKYQGIPRDGYTELVANIVRHPLITVDLGVEFAKEMTSPFDHVFYSGALDEWFDYDMGRLGYRTLQFEREVHDGDFQGCAVMSYPDASVPFTRITEHKDFAPWERHERTVVFREYSSLAGPGDILYYPIRLAEEQKLLNEYIARAKLQKGVSFVGRLGTYRYLDMDVTIGEALKAIEKVIEASQRGEGPPVFFVEP